MEEKQADHIVSHELWGLFQHFLVEFPLLIGHELRVLFGEELEFLEALDGFIGSCLFEVDFECVVLREEVGAHHEFLAHIGQHLKNLDKENIVFISFLPLHNIFEAII